MPRPRGATSCRPRSRPRRPASPPANGRSFCARRSANTARRRALAAQRATKARAPDDVRADVDRVSKKLGTRLKFLVGKPGLDGHSNGAEQIAVRARDAGMDVVYEGIRLTPAEIVVDRARGRRARGRAVDPVGLARAAGEGRGRAHEARRASTCR